MTVARRLRGSLVAFVVLIAAVMAFQVHMIRTAADSTQALAGISARLRIISTDQAARITRMRDDAEKFTVTRDTAYLARAREAREQFARDLARLDSLELTREERSALARLAIAWRRIAPDLAPLKTLSARLEPVEMLTGELGAASQAAMSAELRAVDAAARATERLSMAAATAAVILMIVLSARLARSVLGPLSQLAEGTRQVSRGHFGHRLDGRGDDELAQVARDFNAMTARLDEVDNLKRAFVARVSHDLKTPLSSMQETTAALIDGLAGPVSERQKHLLGMTLDSSRSLSGMLSKLLDLSRLEARIEPARQVVDVGTLIERAVDRLGGSAQHDRVRLEVVRPEAELPVHADVDGLGQVIDNLLENALKFSPAGGTVTIRAWASSGSVCVAVSDQGPGVPHAEKGLIFNQFYQTDAGRAVRGRGVGLGLTICREVVAAHGGTIHVSNNEPRGSVFCVEIPRAAGAPATEAVTPFTGAAA